MKEYNFFESVIEKKKGTNIIGLAITIVVILALGWLTFEASMNLLEFFNLNDEIDALHLQAEHNREQVELLNAVREEVRLLEGKFDYLYRADLMARENRVFTLELMETLPALIPIQLGIGSISVSGNSVRMNGIAPDLETIAQFEHSVRTNSDILYNLFIRNASFSDSIQVLRADGEQDTVEGYDFTAEANIRWDGNYFDLIFDTSADIILRATDPDYIWDRVVEAME